MKFTSILTSFALIAVLAISTTVHAAASAEDAIKYRKLSMESMAANYGILMMLLFDKVDAKDSAQGHADAVAHAASALDTMFPENSREGDTDSLPAIWKNADAFAKTVSKAQQAANDLQAAVASGDRKATLSAAAAVGKSCKGCHESYRAEDD